MLYVNLAVPKKKSPPPNKNSVQNSVQYITNMSLVEDANRELCQGSDTSEVNPAQNQNSHAHLDKHV